MSRSAVVSWLGLASRALHAAGSGRFGEAALAVAVAAEEAVELGVVQDAVASEEAVGMVERVLEESVHPSVLACLDTVENVVPGQEAAAVGEAVVAVVAAVEVDSFAAELEDTSAADQAFVEVAEVVAATVELDHYQFQSKM